MQTIQASEFKARCLALMDQVDARRMILTDGRLDIYE